MNYLQKKNKNLEKSRGIFFQIGLIIAGGLTLIAFEWMSPINPYDLPQAETIFDEEWELPPIIPEKEIIKPEVKFTEVKKKSEIIEIVINEPIEKKEEEKEEEKKELKFDPEKWKEKEKVKEEEPPKAWVERMPYYEDCKSLKEAERKKCTQEKMYQHFGKKIRVPESIKLQGKATYMAFVYFEVSKTGKIINVKILSNERNKIPKELERQALGAVKTLPQMIPGNHNGRKVGVLYKMPIKFTIL